METQIRALQPYMLSHDFVFEKREDLDDTFRKNDKFYRINEKDSLFWGLYILVNGFEKYESLLPASFSKEKEEKFTYINLVQQPYSKTLLKEKQIKNNKKELENNLANDDLITVKTFISLAILNKIDFLFFENKKVYTNGMLSRNIGDNKNLFVIFYEPQKRECSIDLNVNPSEIKFLLETYFPWETIEKPLKAITYYSLEELQKISEQMGYKSNENRKDNKKSYYDFITKQIF
jgi:hypothetical protein